MSHLEHDTLWALSRSELTADDAQAAKSHLAQCAECRVALEDVQLAQSVLSVLPEVPPMPEAMARRVGASLAEAADARAAKHFTSWWQSLFTPRFVFAAALATVLVIVGAWVLASINAPEPSAPIATPTPAPLTPSPLPAPQVNPKPAPARKLSATVASAKKSSTSKSQVLAEGSTVATQSGGSVWMKLPDGSRAGLTATSEVKLATLEEKQLTLELNKGNLAMVVPHRLDRVLTVRAGDLEVKDLGTRFLVSRDQNRTLVAVEEGKVEVKTPTGTREVHANHAVTWSGGQLVELPWEASAPPAPQPVATAVQEPEVVPEGQPNSIARLSDEEEEDDTSPPPPEEVQEEPEALPPDRTPMAADEQWEGLPPKAPGPQPLGAPPQLVPPRRAVTATERGFSLKNLERKLRELGSTITSPTLREASMRNIVKAADAGECQFALQLADRWLTEPVTGAANERTMRRTVQLQQVRCLNHLGRKDDAATLLKMIESQR